MKSTHVVSFKINYTKAITQLRAELRTFLKLADTDNHNQQNIDLNLGSDASNLAKAMWNLLICLDNKDATLDTAKPNYNYIKLFDYSDVTLETPFLNSFMHLLTIIYNHPKEFIDELEKLHPLSVNAAGAIARTKRGFFNSDALNQEITEHCQKLIIHIFTIFTKKIVSVHQESAVVARNADELMSCSLNVIEEDLKKEASEIPKENVTAIINKSIRSFRNLISTHFNHTSTSADKIEVDEIEKLKVTLRNQLRHADMIKMFLSSTSGLSHLDELESRMREIKNNYKKLTDPLDRLTALQTKLAEITAKQVEIEHQAALAKNEQDEKTSREAAQPTVEARKEEKQPEPAKEVKEIKEAKQPEPAQNAETEKFAALKKKVDKMAGKSDLLRISDKLASPSPLNSFNERAILERKNQEILKKREQEILETNLKEKIASISLYAIPVLSAIDPFSIKKKSSARGLSPHELKNTLDEIVRLGVEAAESVKQLQPALDASDDAEQKLEAAPKQREAVQGKALAPDAVSIQIESEPTFWQRNGSSIVSGATIILGSVGAAVAFSLAWPVFVIAIAIATILVLPIAAYLLTEHLCGVKVEEAKSPAMFTSGGVHKQLGGEVVGIAIDAPIPIVADAKYKSEPSNGSRVQPAPAPGIS